MRLFSFLYTGRLLTRPITRSVKNLNKARKKAAVQIRKNNQALNKSIVLRNMEQIKAAQAFTKLKLDEARIQKLNAETRLIEARTAQMDSGLKLPQCPQCLTIYSQGEDICPTCNIETKKVSLNI